MEKFKCTIPKQVNPEYNDAWHHRIKKNFKRLGFKTDDAILFVRGKDTLEILQDDTYFYFMLSVYSVDDFNKYRKKLEEVAQTINRIEESVSGSEINKAAKIHDNGMLSSADKVAEHNNNTKNVMMASQLYLGSQGSTGHKRTANFAVQGATAVRHIHKSNRKNVVPTVVSDAGCRTCYTFNLSDAGALSRFKENPPEDFGDVRIVPSRGGSTYTCSGKINKLKKFFFLIGEATEGLGCIYIWEKGGTSAQPVEEPVNRDDGGKYRLARKFLDDFYDRFATPIEFVKESIGTISTDVDVAESAS